MEWEAIPRDEQETVINVNYFEKKISFYTCRKSVADRLLKKIGQPSHVDMHEGKICGVTYIRNLFDKDLAKFFSKTLLVGSFEEKQ